MPVAERDLSVVGPAWDTNRTRFLLPATDAVRTGVVGRDVIQLRRGLVVPGTPRPATVHRDDGALVRGQEHDVGVVWIDPEPVIIIPTRRAAKHLPGGAAIGRLPRNDASAVHDVRVFRIDLELRKVGTTVMHARVVADLPP